MVVTQDCDILAIASSGGHLTQLLAVLKGMPGVPTRVATDDGVGDLTEARRRGWSIFPKVGRSPRRHLSNVGRQLLLMGDARPRLVFTTGSGWCLPAVLLSHLFGAKSLVLESFSRVEGPSGFAKVAYLFADRTLVQWPELSGRLPRATLVRPVFSARGAGEDAGGQGTFVTVGTHGRGMDRLVEAVDKLAEAGALPAPVFIQVGPGAFTPKHCEWTRTLGREEFSMRLAGAKLVICHAGAGIIGECLGLGKVPLVVPRDPARGEVVDDHQRLMALKLADEGLLRLCASESDIAAAVRSPASNVASVRSQNAEDAERSLPSVASIVLKELGG